MEQIGEAMKKKMWKLARLIPMKTVSMHIRELRR